MRLAWGLLVCSCVVVAACDPPTPTVLIASSPTNRALANDVLMPVSSGLGTAREAITVGDGPNGQQVLFVNFDQTVITVTDQMTDGDPDDARTNRSWIPNTKPAGQTVTVPAFDTTPYTSYGSPAAVKQAIIDDVNTWYMPYNVYVVTTRPASGRYTMVVVGGQTTQVITGQADAVGVAALDCGNQNQNNIGFAFAASEPPQNSTQAAQQQAVLLIAQTIAHEAGHTFGLEHVATVNNKNPTDVMEAAVDPNVGGFLMENANLDSGNSPSMCDSTTKEDTDTRLANNLGPNPGGGPALPKPSVTWLYPKEGNQVPLTFTAAISVAPASGKSVSKVEVVQGGVTVSTMVSPPYQSNFMAPSGLPNGSLIRFTAVATDNDGGKASADVDFTVNSAATQPPIPCMIATDCFSTQTCTNNVCVGPTGGCDPLCGEGTICMNGVCVATTGDGGDTSPDAMMSGAVPVGMACTDSSTCGANGVCATANNMMYCTQACDPANTMSCPADFTCVPVGADHFCGPKGHGGCEMSRSDSPSLLAMFVMFAFAVVRRRRLRPSAT